MKLTHVTALVLLSTGAFFSCQKDAPEEAVTWEEVHAFVITEGGSKLLATDQGLVVLDEAKARFRWLEDERTRRPATDLKVDPSASLETQWMCGQDGAYQLETGTEYNTANSGISDNMLHAMGINPQNGVAFFASDKGVDILHDSWMLYEGFQQFLTRHRISDVGVDSKGYTYVSTLGGGVERFAYAADGISGATLMDTDWSRLRSNVVHSIFVDDTIQAYGTDAGAALHYSEFTKWDWQVLSTAEGLSNDTVLSICRDAQGLWWIGTRNGLNSYDELTQQIQPYTPASHDLLPLPIRHLAMDPSGGLWLATDMGLTLFTTGGTLHYTR